MISFVDNVLVKFRRVFINILTVLFLMLITLSFFYVMGSLFESDKVETEDQVLYLEPNGVILDKAITRNEPFEEFEIFGNHSVWKVGPVALPVFERHPDPPWSGILSSPVRIGLAACRT